MRVEAIVVAPRLFGDDWQRSCFGFYFMNCEFFEITHTVDVVSVERDFQSAIGRYAN